MGGRTKVVRGSLYCKLKVLAPFLRVQSHQREYNPSLLFYPNTPDPNFEKAILLISQKIEKNNSLGAVITPKSLGRAVTSYYPEADKVLMELVVIRTSEVVSSIEN